MNDPNSCPVCSMRMFCQPGNLPPTFETHWNRRGNGKHLTQDQAIGRVCQHNSRPGCLNQGKRAQVLELPPKGLFTEEERSEMVAELTTKLGGEADAA